MPQDIISQFDRKFALPIETNRQFATIPLRNAIPMANRWEGMIVYCKDTQLSYTLKGGLDNTFWVNLGDIVDVTVVDNLDSYSSTDALSANMGRELKDLIDNIDLSDYQLLSEKGATNGYAPLDSGAKVPLANLPDAVLGQVQYKGTWNASTNTPTLTDPTDSTTKGFYYIVSAAGTRFSIDFQVGDWVISNGANWQKVDNTDAVTSVFGRLGAVVANSGDYAAYYLRKDVADTKTAGDLTFAENVNILFSTKSRIFGGTSATSFDLIDGDLLIRNNTTTQFTFGRTTGNLTAAGYLDALRYYAVSPSNNWAFRGVTNSLNYSGLWFQPDHTSQLLLRNAAGTIVTKLSANGSNSDNIINNNTIWHAGNDGAGSGLDADLVRGNAPVYANARTDNGYIWLRRSSGSGSATLYVTQQDGAGDIMRLYSGAGDGTTKLIVSNSGAVTSNSFFSGTAYKTANWEIVETSGVLQFKYGGVTKFEFNSSGIAEAADDWKLGL